MKVHPQVFTTLKLIERLRTQRKVKRLEIRFGPRGLEGAWIDGELSRVEQETKITIDNKTYLLKESFPER